MSDLDFLDDFLEHFGKKGMRWGVRNDRGHEGQRARTGKIKRLDKKFERNVNNINTLIKIHNRAAKLSNDNDVPRINNKPQYKGKDFTRDSPLRQKYYKEHQKAFLDNASKAAKELGTNASGTKRYDIIESPSGNRWDIVVRDVKHANVSDDIEISIKVNFDILGHISSLEIIEPKLLQTNLLIDDFLSHYGKKGMRWGVRSSKGGATKFVKSSKPTKPKAKDLSDEELRKAVNRMQMEKQYTSLIKGSSSKKGSEFVANIGKTAVKTALTAVVTQQVNVALKKAKIAK